MRHNDGDRHQHGDGKRQQGNRQYDDGDGQQNDRRHDESDTRRTPMIRYFILVRLAED